MIELTHTHSDSNLLTSGKGCLGAGEGLAKLLSWSCRQWGRTHCGLFGRRGCKGKRCCQEALGPGGYRRWHSTARAGCWQMAQLHPQRLPLFCTPLLPPTPQLRPGPAAALTQREARWARDRAAAQCSPKAYAAPVHGNQLGHFFPGRSRRMGLGAGGRGGRCCGQDSWPRWGGPRCWRVAVGRVPDPGLRARGRQWWEQADGGPGSRSWDALWRPGGRLGRFSGGARRQAVGGAPLRGLWHRGRLALGGGRAAGSCGACRSAGRLRPQGQGNSLACSIFMRAI